MKSNYLQSSDINEGKKKSFSIKPLCRSSGNVSEGFMFEIKYPGHCFGNMDVTSKECKKCRISQCCKDKKLPYSKDIGTSSFMECLEKSFRCSTEEKETSLEVKCYKKDGEDFLFSVNFNEDGHIKIGEKEFCHIPSKEIAEKIIEEMKDDIARNISDGL